MEKNNNHTTIEDLATLIQGTMASKEDIMELRIEMKDILKDTVAEMDAMHSDVRYIRSTVDKLVHNDIAQDATIQDLTARVHRLEKKIGFAR